MKKVLHGNMGYPLYVSVRQISHPIYFILIGLETKTGSFYNLWAYFNVWLSLINLLLTTKDLYNSINCFILTYCNISVIYKTKKCKLFY